METEIQKMLKDAGLDWSVRTETLQTTESGIIVPKKIAVIRNDNDVVLGDHKSGYTPYQNHDFLELLFKISHQTGLELHTGGFFGEGGRIFFQLKSNNLTLGTDRIEGYVTGINSFDGSTSLAFGNSNDTISCGNTFWLVYRSLKSKMKHTANMLKKIEEILQKVDKLIVEEKKNFTTITRLADVPITKELEDAVVRKLFTIPKEVALTSDEISTNKRNKMNQFYADLAKEIQTKENTLWGLFSGVTRYTTHSMKKTDNTENKIFGRVGTIEREIWHSLASVVEN